MSSKQLWKAANRYQQKHNSTALLWGAATDYERRHKLGKFSETMSPKSVIDKWTNTGPLPLAAVPYKYASRTARRLNRQMKDPCRVFYKPRRIA